MKRIEKDTLILDLMLLAFVVFFVVFTVVTSVFCMHKQRAIEVEKTAEAKEEVSGRSCDNDFSEFWIPYQTTVISGAQQ